MEEGALSGYKVVDLTEYVAGPYCTRILASLGAEVIKVEKPGDGDASRKLGPFYKDDPHPEKSLAFLYLNTGKKSVTLNLKNRTGMKILKDMVKSADILVESFGPGVMQSLGLGYETLSKINPKLIVASISNFGDEGPYKDYKAADITHYALSGLMSMTGDPDRAPLMLGFDIAQLVAGQNAVNPLLAALYSREVTGAGQHLSLSILNYNAGLIEYQAAQYSYRNWVHRRIGNVNEKGHPWGALLCGNGWVIMCAQAGYFRFIADMMGIPELYDPKFATSYDRIQNRDELDALMLPWLVEHDKEEIFHNVCTKPSVAGGMDRNIEEVVNCPQLEARGYFISIEHPMTGKQLYPGAPYKMSETPWRTNRAPMLGEHNYEIYSLLGYNEEDLRRFRGAGII